MLSPPPQLLSTFHTHFTFLGRPKLPEDVTLPGYPHLGIDRYEEKQKNGAFAVSVAGMGWLPGPEQTYSFGLAALASLANIGPDQSSMTTYISEGLHFRGGSREWRILLGTRPVAN